MRIAFITASSLPMPPVNGGAVENLIDIILKYNELSGEHDITVYSCESQKALDMADTYKKSEFIYINTNSVFYKLNKGLLYIINKISKRYHGNAFIRQIAKLIYSSDNKFDAIIIENRPEYAIPIRKVYKGDIILHLHNDLLNKDTRYSKAIIKSQNAIYTVSDYIKGRVQSIGNNIYIKTIYNGVNIDLFNYEIYAQKREDLRQKYGFKSDDIIFMFSGRLNEAKGIDKLMEAFVELPKELNTKLLVVGSSIYGKTKEDAFLTRLKQIANKRKEDIIFTGYIDYNDIPKIHAVSDIAVIPSVWDDPSPLTVYEAMSSGLPILTTDSGGIPELVTEECAIIVQRDAKLTEKLKDEMIKLALDNKLRERMAYHSRLRGENFSKERFASVLLNEVNIKFK
ncbi:MAG: hypothetical protein DBY38_00175 [Clostridium cadaveris]|uniref:Glycosyl transferase family 1 domain-containing protein n=1 Tax=Clostridium cadaveris TaxID=1529 RepID=A0A316MF54_9CLOT|nr:MAG: hypothetical protein DBY38_00175 [Clostridium cadaveris]